MSDPVRVAFIGNSLPRRCGIATFTTDLQQAVQLARPSMETAIVAMTDHGQSYNYPPAVTIQIRDGSPGDYLSAAAALNASQPDVVCLQHEFGIFGGEAGAHILLLLARLTMPVVTTFHTVLADPTPAQREVMTAIINTSAKVIVMADKGMELLRTVYRVPTDKIEVIAHGIPDFAFVEPDAAKAKLGFGGRSVVLTFGLLSPNKGIEVMIDAMPAIRESRRDAVYVVLGATHPNLVREQGEAYRECLQARARALGVEDHVIFLNQFVDLPTLLDFIAMCDVYVTPYLNEAQMTSGTLAYSFGLGKAVVSTPYWHARELLANDRGVLVPFGDSGALGREIAGLLTDPERRNGIRQRAYAASRSMIWSRTAERYLAAFASVSRQSPPLRIVARPEPRRREHRTTPAMRTNHLMAMCDDTGLFQHAVHAVPDRSHGYCVDDNARALLLALALEVSGEQALPGPLTSRFTAFVQHAWNPGAGRFRNFMSFDRRWLEDCGSEDSHGRTLWALGECVRDGNDGARQAWASSLFAAAIGAVETFGSPRAWGFALLGLDGYCAARPGDRGTERLRRVLANRLIALLAAVETPDWVWFEEGLSYDNARPCQALIMTGKAMGEPVYVRAGLRTLRWLMAQQTGATGQFRPIGTAGFFNKRQPPEPFDQQPVEAAAAISACLAAWRADGDPAWHADAARAFNWFLGANDLSVSLVDVESGSCRDGLHPDRANENRGGESVVSYLLGLAEIRQLARLTDGLSTRIPRLA
jgi:glycosyltransferase involved in cell wall biosynthesis